MPDKCPGGWAGLQFKNCSGHQLRGIKWSFDILSARNIWPLLDLLAKLRQVFAFSCSFFKCLHARILVKMRLLEILLLLCSCPILQIIKD